MFFTLSNAFLSDFYFYSAQIYAFRCVLFLKRELLLDIRLELICTYVRINDFLQC